MRVVRERESVMDDEKRERKGRESVEMEESGEGERREMRTPGRLGVSEGDWSTVGMRDDLRRQERLLP